MKYLLIATIAVFTFNSMAAGIFGKDSKEKKAELQEERVEDKVDYQKGELDRQEEEFKIKSEAEQERMEDMIDEKKENLEQREEEKVDAIESEAN